MMDDGDGEISLEDFLHGARWGSTELEARKALKAPKAPKDLYIPV